MDARDTRRLEPELFAQLDRCRLDIAGEDDANRGGAERPRRLAVLTPPAESHTATTSVDSFGENRQLARRTSDKSRVTGATSTTAESIP